MKKQAIILTTVLIAGLVGSGFVLNEMWLPFFICLGYVSLVLWANTKGKAPCGNTGPDQVSSESIQRSEEGSHSQIINFYDNTVRFGTQTKVWTPAGKAVIPMHYEE